jgi:hypothetical protein
MLSIAVSLTPQERRHADVPAALPELLRNDDATLRPCNDAWYVYLLCLLHLKEQGAA